MPSHIGIPGNKEVDCLAEQASQSPCLQNTQVHYSDLREESKRAAFLRTKEKTQTQGLLHDTQSLFRINVVDSPLCKCNLHEENLNHVLWQYSLYNPQRNKQLVSLIRIGLLSPLNVESIVAIPHIKACEAM